MSLPDTTLSGMRKTNDIFCSTAVRLRDMSALDHVYTPDAQILPPGADLITIGSGLSLGPLVIIFTVVPLFGMDPHRGSWYAAVVPVLSLFPLTLAYVLIVQRAMDLRILLRIGTKYLLARATVLTAEIALVAFLVLRFIVPMMQRKEHPFLNFVLLAVCIGALFQIFTLRDSFSQRLQRWLDRKFSREAYNQRDRSQ